MGELVLLLYLESIDYIYTYTSISIFTDNHISIAQFDTVIYNYQHIILAPLLLFS